ncbi:hypothetical protein [Streptomyces sp. NPDC048606]|uniref:hypothetical protein n=1 Tax=Streptomyces sp. NPDC048606 TaxID=3154726 RepID=UPI003434AA46
MTTHQNSRPTPPPADNQAFLPLRTAVVLLTALVLGLIVGALTALTGTHPATAVIAGLTTTGAATAALHTLIR